MPIKGASSTVDQDWLDLKELANENAAALFIVRDIEPETDYGNGPLAPVRADVLVLTGRHAGEVHLNERIMPKGVRMKLTEIGDEVVGRLTIYGSRKAVGLNAEHDGDIELAEKALAKFHAERADDAKVKVSASVGDDEPPF